MSPYLVAIHIVGDTAIAVLAAGIAWRVWSFPCRARLNQEDDFTFPNVRKPIIVSLCGISALHLIVAIRWWLPFEVAEWLYWIAGAAKIVAAVFLVPAFLAHDAAIVAMVIACARAARGEEWWEDD